MSKPPKLKVTGTARFDGLPTPHRTRLRRQLVRRRQGIHQGKAVVNKELSTKEEQLPTVEISCVEVWHELSELVDHTLDEGMRERLVLHLRNCAHCTAVYAGTRNIVQLLGDEQVVDLPSGFRERLFQRLSSEFCH